MTDASYLKQMVSYGHGRSGRCHLAMAVDGCPSATLQDRSHFSNHSGHDLRHASSAQTDRASRSPIDYGIVLANRAAQVDVIKECLGRISWQGDGSDRTDNNPNRVCNGTARNIEYFTATLQLGLIVLGSIGVSGITGSDGLIARGGKNPRSVGGSAYSA
jgi:hypothetical protein